MNQVLDIRTLRHRIFVLLFSIWAGAGCLDAEPGLEIEDRMVVIKAYQQQYDWLIPWNKNVIETRTGMASAVRISPDSSKNKVQWFLTAADLVKNATLLEATPKGEFRSSRLKLEHIDHALNLALLSLADDAVFERLERVEWGAPEKGEVLLPDLSPGKRGPLKGIIEGLMVGHRKVRDAWLPVLQVSLKDVPPQGSILIQKGKAVGMILNGSQGTFNALPTQLVLRFLEQEKQQQRGAFAHRGFNWKTIPQQSMAEFARIPYDVPGIWISRVLNHGTGSQVLMKGDYLTHLGSWALSGEGQIEHPDWGPVLFDALFLDEMSPGDTVKLTVYREGKQVTLKTIVDVFRENGHLVPLKQFDRPPSYLIRGGLLFQELTQNYLEVWGGNWGNAAPLRLRLYKQLDYRHSSNRFSGENGQDERIVILTQVLPDSVNIGYQNLRNLVVRRVNGMRIGNLESLVQAFENPVEGYHRIEFSPGGERVRIILPEKGLAEADRRILNNYQIPNIQVL